MNNPNNHQNIPLGTYLNGQILTKNGWVPYKKRSGSKSGFTKDNKFYVTAWNRSKEKGFIKVSAFENKKSTRFENEHGEESIMLMFEIFYERTGNKLLEIAQYKFKTGKAFLSTLNMVISTKSNNGGYFGKNKSK